ncbi:MAG: ThuA domain-containing protein [Clostridiales bacterium]|nr:ThuA domain-containing protein [Clostridiales bacterium]
MHRILVISDGFFHPSLICRYAFKRLLTDLDEDFHFEFTKNINVLSALREKAYSAVILYFHKKRIKESALSGLEAFASKGGGVFAIHSAMASFKTSSRYQKILGGRFTGHGPIDDIAIRNVPSKIDIGLKSISFSIKDELYIHDYDSDNDILLEGVQNGIEEPILWIKCYGNGKVAYLSLGHRKAVFEQNEVKSIIEKVLNWISTREV